MAADYFGYIPSEIKKTRKQAGVLGAKAAQLGAGAFTFPEALKEAVQKKVGYHEDLIREQAKAQAEYFAAPAKARAKYVKQPTEEGYVTPIQAEKLVAQEKAQAYVPYATTTGVLQQAMGTIPELVGAGTGAYQAQVAAAQGAQQIARQAYQDLLSEYTTGAQLYGAEQDIAFRQQQFEEQQQQFAQQLQLQQLQQQLQQEQWEWEKPYQERMYEYQLAEPYYKPTAGETTDTVATPDTPAPRTALDDEWDDYVRNITSVTGGMWPIAGGRGF